MISENALIDPLVKQRLLERLQRLKSEGRLLPRAQLDGYYATFRERFGPEVLAGLDGEALLETMHGGGNKDSLVYWLEFKNDDEFKTRPLGSIAGGSADKFGLFRRVKTEAWEVRKGTNFRELAIDEAVAIAQKHRNQLIRSVEVLQTLAPGASDENYRKIQETLDADAPDISGRAWGHKYLSLLFPNVLDDYHNPDLQRFYLRKMLQEPPDDGDGRFVCAGRFVASADELEVPVNHLTTALNSLNRRHKYWLVKADSPERWSMMRDGGLTAVGWAKLGDLSWLPKKITKDDNMRFRGLIDENYPDRRAATKRIMDFVVEMGEGDIVVAVDGDRALGVGRVMGDYVFETESEFPHQRPVEWLSFDEWKLPATERKTIPTREIKSGINILEIERRIQSSPGPIPPQAQPSTSLQTPRRAPRLEAVPGRIQAVLDRKSQCILHGPPGTGKTYWAERTARELAAHRAFGAAFDQLGDAEKAEVVGTDQGDGLVRFCCFHPSYGYEDFIEGYRPEVVDGQLAFRLRDGVFKRLCQDAEKAPDRRFFLIVDEINRGDIPRIFGELLTVLEKDKRSKAILLPVSGEPFRVPPNVFLIGTMNTADRSISLLDAALRRRFGFVEMMPDASVLRGHSVGGVPLAPWLDALNERVRRHVGRNARHLQVGHSYLLEGGRPVRDMSALRLALRDDILPLLEEYCYEDFQALRDILGENLLDLENGRVRWELFEDELETDLIEALLAPCPDITATTDALEADLEDEEIESDEDENEEDLEDSP